MRRVVAAVAVALFAAGCGSDGDDAPVDHAPVDHAPAFVGTWSGSSVVVMDGFTSHSPSTYTRIVRTGTNAVVMNDVCADGSGPAATITSGNGFTTAAINCPPVAVEECSAVSLVMNGGGTGSLNDGQLQATLSGALTGCGYTYPLSFTFTGTRTSTSTGAALTVENPPEASDERVMGDAAPELAGFRF
jgi:predicted small lipoprotein YifL